MRLRNFNFGISKVIANFSVVRFSGNVYSRKQTNKHTRSHTHTDKTSFHILSNMFLVGTAGRALTFGGFHTQRFGDLQIDPTLTAVNLPALFVAVCCGVGLAAGMSMALSTGCNHWWLAPRSRQHVCPRHNQ